MEVKLEGPRFIITFAAHESRILNDLYGSELSVAHGISKIMTEWLKGRLGAHEDRERIKLYETFKNLPTDEQHKVLTIMARE